MWPDNETTRDLIGFRVHADLIRAVVTKTSMLPTTIGIFGDWGGGKTSIMKMLAWDLDPEHWPANSQESADYEGVAVVYVNTWLFEGYDDAKAALLGAVLLELAEHKKFGPKVRDGIVSLLASVNWMRAAKYAMTHVAVPAAAAFFTGGMATIPAAVALSTGLSSLVPGSSPKATEDKDKPAADEDKAKVKADPASGEQMDVRTFRTRFAKMLRDGGITTLVVLVDDLDRCTPERIVDNLEAVKLFLSAEQTAFVIGADRRIVEHAIRSRYATKAVEGNDEESRRLVKDYLEKLVQVPYSLPRLSTTEIETYMALLFCNHHLKEQDFTICETACNENRSKNRYSSFGYAAVRDALRKSSLDKAELVPALTAALTFSAAAAPLIADGLKGNPRQVKRFLNALLLRKELARVAKLENIRDDVLVKLMILEYAHPELFTELFSWQAQQSGHPKQLASLESILGPKGDINDEDSAKKIDPKWATSSIRRWVAMEPMLKDVDLRDYFWVARDKLESTFSGISMVSPVVRAVLDGLLSTAVPQRNAAMRTASQLTEDERASLLSLVNQKITRQYDQMAGYDALRFLIEADVSGAGELLANILDQGPLDKMPAPVGMQFMNIYNAKTAIRPKLEAAKKRLSQSTTAIGLAMQASLPAKK